MSMQIHTSAPGRICLFGEHQDYLDLPVIAMGIDLRFHIQGTLHTQPEFEIHTPDIDDGAVQTLPLDLKQPRSRDDFIWGILRVLQDEGFTFPRTATLNFHSEIPFRAGCSSSSAMTAAWMRLLLEIGEHANKAGYVDDPERVAHLVYKGEKELFHGAGGMMDQYSCYLGGLVYVFPRDSHGVRTENAAAYGVERLANVPEDLILIDSGQPKDTQGVLATVGDRARGAVQLMREKIPEFNLKRTLLSDFDAQVKAIPLTTLESESCAVVRDHIINRDLCREGLDMLRTSIDPQRLGAMLTEEHRILSETLGISTPAIDSILTDCLEAGALGGKINGSGGGGTCFCYAPGRVDAVCEMLTAKNVRHFRIHKDSGARLESN